MTDVIEHEFAFSLTPFSFPIFQYLNEPHILSLLTLSIVMKHTENVSVTCPLSEVEDKVIREEGSLQSSSGILPGSTRDPEVDSDGYWSVTGHREEKNQYLGLFPYAAAAVAAHGSDGCKVPVDMSLLHTLVFSLYHTGSCSCLLAHGSPAYMPCSEDHILVTETGVCI